MIEIECRRNLDVTLEVPGSKSLTQRALIAASLAEGESLLRGALMSEDTAYTSKALRQVGAQIEYGHSWKVQGLAGKVGPAVEPIYLGNNGTATRFLTSVLSLGDGPYTVDGDQRMHDRPIGPLMTALHGWGVDVRSLLHTGFPPLAVNAAGLEGGETILTEGRSSQYLSSLLLVAPYAEKRAELRVEGEILSKPYINMTLDVMASFGINVEYSTDFTYFRIPQGCYKGREYNIEGDASSASYFWAAAAITGGRVCVKNVPVPSLQGDAMFAPLLGRMGCKINVKGGGITVIGPEKLHGITIDMGNMPDVVPTLAVVAAFAEGDTVIENIGHLRIKECDRLSATVSELLRLGVEVEELDEAMIIHGKGGRGMQGATIETYHDHRMAMSMALAGLVVPGVKITDEGCVAKSFPDFWERFTLLGFPQKK